jgi:hypothetical protein
MKNKIYSVSQNKIFRIYALVVFCLIIGLTANGQCVYFQDQDGDGFGNPDLPGFYDPDCFPPPFGYVNNQSDCNDNDANMYPRYQYLDLDGDGYGSEIYTFSCQPLPANYSYTTGDCDDNNSLIHPGAIEICGDGIDNDCLGGDQTCSEPCTIIITFFGSPGPCSDNGTPNDPSDDYFTQNIGAAFFNRPLTGNLQIVPGGDAIGTYSIPVSGIIGNSYVFNGVKLKADGTPSFIQMNFTDAPTCIDDADGPAVQSCSVPPDPCTISITFFGNPGPCNDNSTPNDPTDDYFTQNIGAAFFNRPLTGNLQIVPGGDAIGTYSVPVSSIIGNSYTFNGVKLKADGTQSIIQMNFTDEPACIDLATGPTVSACNYPPPVLDCRADTNLGCVPPPFITDFLPASSFSCPGGFANIIVIQSNLPPIGCIHSSLVKYIVTDQCGGISDTCRRTFTWTEDNTPPQFSNCSAGYDLGCTANVPTCQNQVAPTATDNCGVSSVTCSEGSISNTSTYGRSRTITWTATDCGNKTATCSKTFTWKESSPIIVDAGPNKVVYKGYPDSTCAKLQSTISGGVAPLSRNWSTAGNQSLGSGSFINVCPTSSKVYYLTVTDANGCNATDSVRVCVVDVRCGNGNKNVIICHGTGSATNPFITLCIDKSGAKWHLQNHPGEQLGTCGQNKTCNWTTGLRLEDVEMEEVPEGEEYLNAFPNPFSGISTVRFMIPEDDFVDVEVFDLAGREMEKLFSGQTEAGNVYDVSFDGSKFSSGIYFLVLSTRSGVNQTRKLLLNK